MNELFREIEEDIRRERLDKLWKQFGKILIGISISIVLVTIVVVSVQYWRESEAKENTARFIKATALLDKQDYKGAIAMYDELAEESDGYYSISMLRKGYAQLASGDKEGAQKTYVELAKHDEIFGALAGMLAEEDGKVTIEPDEDSPFYYSQIEHKAWQLLQVGKKTESLGLFSKLDQDVRAPATMRARARQVIQYLGATKESKHD